MQLNKSILKTSLRAELNLSIKKLKTNPTVSFAQDQNLNLIESLTERVWYPDLSVFGSDKSLATLEHLFTMSWAHRVAKPLPDDDQNIEEGTRSIFI